jgi:hypothetical protein
MQPSKKRTRKDAFSESESDFEPDETKKAKTAPKASKKPHPNVEEETKEAPKVKVDKIITDYKWKVHPSTRNQPEKTLDKS